MSHSTFIEIDADHGGIFRSGHPITNHGMLFYPHDYVTSDHLYTLRYHSRFYRCIRTPNNKYFAIDPVGSLSHKLGGPKVINNSFQPAIDLRLLPSSEYYHTFIPDFSKLKGERKIASELSIEFPGAQETKCNGSKDASGTRKRKCGEFQDVVCNVLFRIPKNKRRKMNHNSCIRFHKDTRELVCEMTPCRSLDDIISVVQYLKNDNVSSICLTLDENESKNVFRIAGNTPSEKKPPISVPSKNILDSIQSITRKAKDVDNIRKKLIENNIYCFENCVPVFIEHYKKQVGDDVIAQHWVHAINHEHTDNLLYTLFCIYHDTGVSSHEFVHHALRELCDPDVFMEPILALHYLMTSSQYHVLMEFIKESIKRTIAYYFFKYERPVHSAFQISWDTEWYASMESNEFAFSVT
jgi:hypothetical protein